MAVLLSICAMILMGQEPTKKQKKEKQDEVVPAHVIDTVTVSTATREPIPDSIHVVQEKALEELDDILEKKKKK